MAETWLRTNRRGLLIALVPGLLIGLAGGGLIVMGGTNRAWPVWAGLGLIALGCLAAATPAWQFGRPRLAYQHGELLIGLRFGPPVRVPIGVVEGFLLGQGPSLLPGRAHADSETATLVIRLAERAEEWSRLEVEPALGQWCAGYVTIRGTWCEPLSVSLVNDLNQRLAAAQPPQREKVAR